MMMMMTKMSSFGTNTRIEMSVPLIYCIIDHALILATRHTSSISASVHQCHELLSIRAAAAFLLKFCTQPGSNLGC